VPKKSITSITDNGPKVSNKIDFDLELMPKNSEVFKQKKVGPNRQKSMRFTFLKKSVSSSDSSDKSFCWVQAAQTNVQDVHSLNPRNEVVRHANELLSKFCFTNHMLSRPQNKSHV
jgi:hypothetical protein